MKKTVNLGPRIVHIGKDKVLGFCDEVTITVAEATLEELTELQNAPMIYLVKLAPWQRRARNDQDRTPNPNPK